MKKLKQDLIVRCVKLLHLVLIVGAFVGSWYGYYAQHLLHPYYRRGNWVIIILFAAIYIFLARIYEAYLISTNRIADTIYSQVLSFLIADIFLFIITWLVNKYFPNVIPFLITVAVQTAVSVIWTVVTHIWYFKTHDPKDAIVVFDERKDLEQLIYEYGYDKKFKVKKILTIEECIEDLGVLEEAETVFLSDIHSHERNVVLKYCVEKGITVYVIPRIGDVIMSGARSMHMFHLPVLRVGRYHPAPEYTIIKKVFDIVFSLIGIIIFSPVMLLVAATIKFSDGGPVFYKQKRLTKNGRIFEVIKFRSMKVDAEKDGVARLSAGENDDRITPVGKIIRRFRLDELPQLFNIFKGDMSFVGPRPERPEIAAQYEESIPEFSLRLQANAGLTGYAQVYGKYNSTPYNKLEMDLLYIAKPSMLEDLRILFATIKILFLPDSTDGVDIQSITALDEAKSGKSETTTLIQ